MIFRDGNVTIAGDPVDEGARAQIYECAKHFEYAIMCADHHKGYTVPIGGVLGDPEKFSPAAVGYDIACGMKAVRLDAPASLVKQGIAKIMDDIQDQISFGIGRRNKTEVDHALFDSPRWSLPAVAPLKQMAREQLGTVGGGNHWVNVFSDENGDCWIGCHFGSRGLGHKTATWVLKQMGAVDSMDGPPPVLHEKSALGAEYIEAIELSGDYAYAGRDWVCDTVKSIIGAPIVEEVHLHHNFLWKEQHGDESLWVGRKGATPAFPGQKGLVGASMAEPCVILEGVESSESKDFLYSTVHGAGRVMSRTEAKGKTVRRTGEIKSPGKVSREMMDEWVKSAGVELRGGDLDESPHVYKRLPEVLSHHENTVRIIRTLTPIGVCMADSKTFDPFKD